MTTYSNIQRQNNVSRNALQIPNFCNSVALKLHNVKINLETLNSITEWDYQTPTNMLTYTLSTSGQPSFGSSTLGTTTPTVSPSPVTANANTSNILFTGKTTQTTQSLDGFFSNIFSTFETFAQIVNLIYFNNPMSVQNVSYDRVISALVRNHTGKLSKLLDGCKNSKLNISARDTYRNYSTHRNALQFKVLLQIEPLIASPSFIVDGILLPDDPNAPATYQRNIESRIYCQKVFKHTLAVLDKAFELMEANCLTQNRIPI